MSASSEKSTLTFLRIKRKRNEEPLDGLVVDIPRKRQREDDRPRGHFKYVDTVEGEHFFQDPSSTQLLQNKITNLTGSPDGADDTSTAASSRDCLATSPVTERTAHYNLVKSSSAGQSLTNKIASLNLDGHSNTTVPQKFTLYEGVTAPHNDAGPILDDGGDPEMSRFNEMVRDYLAEHSPDVVLGSSSTAAGQVVNVAAKEDFVYDVFYFQKEGVTTQDGTRRNVALLTIRAEDDVEFLSFSDDEEEEEEDNDDPDSNDEDNPNNDYPDEESTEDEFSEDNWSNQDESYDPEDY